MNTPQEQLPDAITSYDLVKTLAVVTMIIVPVMYAIMARRGERDKKSKLRKRFLFMDE